MTKLILLTGFLGAGKTTLLKGIMEAYKNRKIGIVVNDFGETNIDGMLLDDNDISMIELSNGSIFCACLKENFIQAIITPTNKDLEYVFVESSGLADPSNMNTISEIVQKKNENSYEYAGSICVIDALYFEEYYNLLPVVERQIHYSDVIIVNKIDTQTSEKLQEIQEKIKKIKPSITIYLTAYCQVDYTTLINDMNPMEHKIQDSINTPYNRPKTITIRTSEDVMKEVFESFIEEISSYAFRIKGFFKLDNKWYEISTVKSQIQIKETNRLDITNELVIISSIGISVISKVYEIWSCHIGKKIIIK